MGELVTVELPADSPVLAMPWIITFGPLEDDEDWEPVVCGPYEHPHAMALASSIVADEDLVAVVEPLLPHVSVEEIRGEIAASRLAGEAEEPADADELELAEEHLEVAAPPGVHEIRAGFARIAASLVGPAVH